MWDCDLSFNGGIGNVMGESYTQIGGGKQLLKLGPPLGKKGKTRRVGGEKRSSFEEKQGGVFLGGFRLVLVEREL